MHPRVNRVPQDGTTEVPGRRLASFPVNEGFIDSGRAARVRVAAPLIDAHFAEAIGELGAPGIAYGVAIDGELVHPAAAACAISQRDPRPTPTRPSASAR